MTKQEIVLSMLLKAIDNKIIFNLYTIDGLFKSYDDSTGQRECYVEHYGYGNPDSKNYPTTFKIMRHCSFINDGDKGKEGAVIGILLLGEIENKKIELKDNSITIGSIRMSFREDLL